MLTLYIGNKNYSSWSLRPWLLLTHLGVDFLEVPVQVRGLGPNDAHRPYSDNGLVPALHDDDIHVYESLAICEYVAELYPHAWPADKHARAVARSVASEMHAGFGALRNAMPLNVQARAKGRPLPAPVQADVIRICQIWEDCQTRFGHGKGPYLFGDFSVADAMFAPVVWRFFCYNVALPPAAAAYRDLMLDHPGMQAWERAALAETIHVTSSDAALAQWGGPREGNYLTLESL
ncbi:glutathione S-transferase family protein [Silvimonas amylolytica]|uniref:Glutathione S-transferase n=1 Tax=Silvimonas amylolytica TaxID=449663 RepID=A0ABQ2PN23_9NEIS|nr:glutathione S-transferase family protein [Silvimonas amylolytica]GGP26601.1 glutathione S-transferase [Silvimonas amylolytica]